MKNIQGEKEEYVDTYIDYEKEYGIDIGKTQRLFMIKKNQLKMVKRRGYNISREENLLSYSLDDFVKAYIPFAKKSKKTVRSILSQTYEKEMKSDKGGDKTEGNRSRTESRNESRNERLYVYFAEPDTKHKQLGVDTISELILQMDRQKSRNGILITPLPLSPPAKKKLLELLSYNINVFSENEMSYDPTAHFFTPEHRALSVEEQRELLQKNGLSIDQFPIILSTDMISRYYGFKPGQIIEIKRVNMYETITPETLSYRAVRDEY